MVWFFVGRNARIGIKDNKCNSWVDDCADVCYNVSKQYKERMILAITINAPAEAVCGLYAGVPEKREYHNAVKPENAIAATSVATNDGITTYFYEGLAHGLYYCGASQEGYNALCQTINSTGNTQLNIELDKLAGGGFEAGYVMQYTREFLEKQLVSHKDAWGAEYAKLFCTPQFMPGRPGRHQQTTNEEMVAFIEKLAASNAHMHIYNLGKSPKYGYDMPLVLFTRENVAGMTLAQAAEVICQNGKPTIQYTAQCHSTEPASTEGALAMMVSLCGDYGKVLDEVDIYIIPRINLDGAYEVTRKSPTTDEDMNRDYLFMHNVELRLITAAYNLFRPEVCIDGHEKWHRFNCAGEDICTDMEVQTGAGALNHPANMTELTMKMALCALEKARSLGLRSHFYSKLASAAGGSAGSSYFGTRNSLSFLVETPGQVNLGMCCMERRVMGQYVLASSVIDYTVEHAAEIVATVRASRDFMKKSNPIYLDEKLFVLEHGSTVTGSWSNPLLHVPSGEVVEENHTLDYKEHTEALATRPRATAYVLPEGLAQEAEILRVAGNHGIDHYRLPAGSTVNLKQYIKTEAGIALTEEQPITFEKGALVFPNTVDSAVLNVIMEPDFNAANPERKVTLLRMGLVKADEDGALPLYRYCHTLENGKVNAQ